MTTIKSNFKWAEDCVDVIADFVKDYLSKDNMCPTSYYEVDKLIFSLGLPFQMIDVHMHYLACQFCGKLTMV